MMKKMFTVKNLCISAVIAALYLLLTMVLAPISYGNIQCRVSEAMTLLPILMPQSIPGLFVGCLLANLLSPTPFLPDIIFGSLTTLVAAILTYQLRNKKMVFAMLPPILLNGIVVGWIVHAFYAQAVPLLLCMLEVAVGEAIAVAAFGTALIVALKKTNVIKSLGI